MDPVVNNDRPTALWRVRNDGRWIEADMRLVRTGVEVEIISNGVPLCSRIFPTSEEALAWAEDERIAFRAT